MCVGGCLGMGDTERLASGSFRENAVSKEGLTPGGMGQVTLDGYKIPGCSRRQGGVGGCRWAREAPPRAGFPQLQPGEGVVGGGPARVGG